MHRHTGLWILASVAGLFAAGCGGDAGQLATSESSIAASCTVDAIHVEFRAGYGVAATREEAEALCLPDGASRVCNQFGYADWIGYDRNYTYPFAAGSVDYDEETGLWTIGCRYTLFVDDTYCSTFRVGDANLDGHVDISDAISIAHGYSSCDAAADYDRNGTVDQADADALLNDLFGS